MGWTSTDSTYKDHPSSKAIRKETKQTPCYSGTSTILRATSVLLQNYLKVDVSRSFMESPRWILFSKCFEYIDVTLCNPLCHSMNTQQRLETAMCLFDLISKFWQTCKRMCKIQLSKTTRQRHDIYMWWTHRGSITISNTKRQEDGLKM